MKFRHIWQVNRERTKKCFDKIHFLCERCHLGKAFPKHYSKDNEHWWAQQRVIDEIVEQHWKSTCMGK